MKIRKKMEAHHFKSYNDLYENDKIANLVYRLNGGERSFSKKLVLVFSHLYDGHPANKRTKNLIIKDIRKYLKIRKTRFVDSFLEDLGMTKIPDREWVKKHRDIEYSFKQYQNFRLRFIKENQVNIHIKILKVIKQCEIEIEKLMSEIHNEKSS